MVSAIPNRKPYSAGSARKFVTNPSRASPAASSTPPAITASAADRPTARFGSDVMSATVAPDSTAAAEVAPMIRNRERPSRTYATRATGAA